VLDIVSRAHNMSSSPEYKILSTLSFNPDIHREITLDNNNSIPDIQLGVIPKFPQHCAALARCIMFLALRPQINAGNMYLMHGGLLVDENGSGCIICGPSGVGKSTAVEKAGKIWEILSDDLVYLTWQDGKFYAQPGPTWSSYIFGKERLVDCDISRIVEVKNVIVLSRIGEFGIHRLSSNQAGLLLANSFIEMTSWNSEFAKDDPETAKALRLKAFDGVLRMAQSTPIYLLTSDVDTDIAPFQRQIQ
jgi:hypothetical protein